VPDDVYERLKDEFVLRERGLIDIKGKGLMRTWYLVGRRVANEPDELRAEYPRAAHV
jgi:adenylate cyclase